jgi:hypothetical protein
MTPIALGSRSPLLLIRLPWGENPERINFQGLSLLSSRVLPDQEILRIPLFCRYEIELS